MAAAASKTRRRLRHPWARVAVRHVCGKGGGAEAAVDGRVVRGEATPGSSIGVGGRRWPNRPAVGRVPGLGTGD
jgi:hypothetical protein